MNACNCCTAPGARDSYLLNTLTVKANEKSEFLFIAGKPIGETIARGGPFVMNTKSEILQAVQDYHNGTFVKK